MPAPTIYVIAGCNGAGKTIFAREFLPSIGVIRFLNADEIARGLSPLRPEAAAFKAGRLLLNQLHELINRQETFALESTLSGRTYVKIFEKAKGHGYAIELHFVWIPDVREAIRRVRQRVIEGGTMFPRRTLSDDLLEAFGICSMITRRWLIDGHCGTTPRRRQKLWQILPRILLSILETSSLSNEKFAQRLQANS
jgi:predicted ABC-type ATPase